MRSFMLLAVLLLNSGCESTALLDDLLASQTGTGTAELSNETIAKGLKEALTVGSGRVVGVLGTKDGFFGSNFRIPLPEKLQQAKSIANKFGLGEHFNELELKLNRAAENATPKAKELFVASIQKMTFDDVLTIYKGPKDAATQYLKQSTAANIQAQMRPVIDSSLADVGAVNTFNALVTRYNALPLVTPIDADVTGHVMGYAQTAIFAQLAAEEAAIRQNPVKRSTELLRSVFGQ